MPTPTLGQIAKPAPYADIFNYIGNFGGNGMSAPGNIGTIGDYTGGMAGQQGGGGEGGGGGGQTVSGGGEGGGTNLPAQAQQQLTYSPNSPAAQALLDKYGQIATVRPEDGTPTYDFSKLPGGGIIQWPGGMGLHPGGYSLDQFMPATDPNKLANSSA